MITVLLFCRRCRYEGRIQVLSPEEVRDPRVSRSPVRCPKCGSQDVQTRR